MITSKVRKSADTGESVGEPICLSSQGPKIIPLFSRVHIMPSAAHPFSLLTRAVLLAGSIGAVGSFKIVLILSSYRQSIPAVARARFRPTIVKTGSGSVLTHYLKTVQFGSDEPFIPSLTYNLSGPLNRVATRDPLASQKRKHYDSCPHPNCIKFRNHPCHTPERSLTQSSKNG
jgi:hypothetical protein